MTLADQIRQHLEPNAKPADAEPPPEPEPRFPDETRPIPRSGIAGTLWERFRPPPATPKPTAKPGTLAADIVQALTGPKLDGDAFFFQQLFESPNH